MACDEYTMGNARTIPRIELKEIARQMCIPLKQPFNYELGGFGAVKLVFHEDGLYRCNTDGTLSEQKEPYLLGQMVLGEGRIGIPWKAEEELVLSSQGVTV